MVVTISDDLATAILTHLQNGGTRMEANLLAGKLVEECNRPAIEAKREEEKAKAISEAVSDALKEAKKKTQAN